MRHKFPLQTRAYTPCPNPALLLSQKEQNIFRFLKRAADSTSPSVELRVAGGWVRDKLLRRDTGDIDVAVRFTTGIRFAEHLHSYSRSTRAKLPISTCTEFVPIVSSVARIKPNPAMSRHLETAAVRLDGTDLDFVHLRTDDYADENRIPTVSHGTPVQDAYRRDFTVNSLFYNLHTNDVEDYTKLGLSDLEARVLRTPLDPSTTLIDDPLRALRAVRFACTLDFELCPRLSDALDDSQLCAVLRKKVSRERIGIEVTRMVTSSDPVRGLGMIGECGLSVSVFGDAFYGLSGQVAYREGVERVKDVLDLLSKFRKLLPQKDWQYFEQYGRAILIFSCFLGNTDRILPVLGNALRRERRMQQDVKRVMMQSEKLDEIIREWRSVRGQFHLREREEETWINIAEIVRDAGRDLWIPVLLSSAQRIGGFELLRELVLSGISSEICGLSYAVDGDRIQAELGIRKGMEVGEALRELMKVQLHFYRRDAACLTTSSRNRLGPTADDCVARLKARRALLERELAKT